MLIDVEIRSVTNRKTRPVPEIIDEITTGVPVSSQYTSSQGEKEIKVGAKQLVLP